MINAAFWKEMINIPFDGITFDFRLDRSKNFYNGNSLGGLDQSLESLLF